MATDSFGIDDLYHDALGTEHEVTEESAAAIRQAMGATIDDVAPSAADDSVVRVLVPGGDRSLQGRAEILLEDGTTRVAEGELPGDLPPGYHRLSPGPGRPNETLLIV